MNDRKITVIIDAMGNPKIEAHNFQGAGCEAATKGIEQALGGNAGVNRSVKSEYYEAEQAGLNQTQGW